TQATKRLSIQGLTKKRFGIFSAGIAALAVSGVLATGFLGKDSEQNPSVTQTPPTVSTERTAKFDDIANPPISSSATNAALEHKPVDQSMKPAPAITQRSPVDSRLAKTSEKATTAIAASGKPSLTAWESYEIIRPTRVLSAPREDSQLVANVEPGTQVNVVDSRNGWLEIRSKHGRPPGFIPKASAIRIRQN
ncbi:MAG TPA: SH3 domain-containing protein, partial [Candidatus Binatia bacterium]